MTHFESTVLFELFSLLPEESAFIFASVSPSLITTYNTFKVLNCCFEAKPMLRNVACYRNPASFVQLTELGRIPKCLIHRQGKHHGSSSKEPKTKDSRVTLGSCQGKGQAPPSVSGTQILCRCKAFLSTWYFQPAALSWS